MKEERKIAIAAKFVSYEEAEENDNIYFSKMTAEELLKECFDLRRINYFGNPESSLPRIEKVGRFINREDHEKQDA